MSYRPFGLLSPFDKELQRERGSKQYKFALARVGGEGHSVKTIAEACNRTEEQVCSAIRKIRKLGDGSVSWAQLYEVLGV
jgi:hypothetical protein